MCVFCVRDSTKVLKASLCLFMSFILIKRKLHLQGSALLCDILIILKSFSSSLWLVPSREGVKSVMQGRDGVEVPVAS